MLFNYYENFRCIFLICELLFFIILLPSFLCYIYDLRKKKKNLKIEIINMIIEYKVAFIIISIIGLMSIVDIGFKIFYTNHNIGSFYEEDNYTDEFYVFISNAPFEESNSIRKVPAEIHSVRGGIKNNSYLLKSLTINNNEKIYFEPSSEIYLNSDTKVYDIEDNIYYIQLTTNKVN